MFVHKKHERQKSQLLLREVKAPSLLSFKVSESCLNLRTTEVGVQS